MAASQLKKTHTYTTDQMREKIMSGKLSDDSQVSLMIWRTLATKDAYSNFDSNTLMDGRVGEKILLN